MATDAEVYRVALYCAGTHLDCFATSALCRDAGHIGLARIPGDFTDADTRRVWEEMRNIGRAMWESVVRELGTANDLSPNGAIQSEPGATPQDAEQVARSSQIPVKSN